jgi:hypothetical protein
LMCGDEENTLETYQSELLTAFQIHKTF